MVSRSVLSLALLALAVACASTEPERPEGSGVVLGATLPQEAAVLVLPVADWQVILEERVQTVRSSGLLVERALRQALETAGWEALVQEAPDLSAALDRARDEGFTYVLETEIVEWQDVSANWRETPDALRLQVRLWDASSRSLVGFGNETLQGAGAKDLVEPTHRLAEPLVQRMLESILAGVPLPEEAWDGEPTQA